MVEVCEGAPAVSACVFVKCYALRAGIWGFLLIQLLPSCKADNKYLYRLFTWLFLRLLFYRFH